MPIYLCWSDSNIFKAKIPYNALMNTTADVHCINLLVITYDLNKLRHTSEVKEKTVFITLSNKPCTFENND